VELKLAWATFPTHVAALAAGRTVLGLGPYVPFTAASFAPGSLFWLAPADPDTEQREHYRPAYHALFDRTHTLLRAAPAGPPLKRLEVCARVHTVLARLSLQDEALLHVLDRLEEELPWTLERLRELVRVYGTLTLFALEVARAGTVHILQRRAPVTSQLGVRPLDPGPLHPVLPPEVLARRVAAIRAVLAGRRAGHEVSLSVQPATRLPSPERSETAGGLKDLRRALDEAEARARAAEARLAELELALERRQAGLVDEPTAADSDGPRRTGDPSHALAGEVRPSGNGATHAAGGLGALKQRIAADVLLPAEWSAELQEFCDLAVESPRHAVAACRRLLQHVIAAAHAVHCRGRSAVGFQARTDDLRNAGCISDLSRRWLLALWDIGTAALHEDVRGWNEQDTEAMVLGTWRVLSAERRSLAVQPDQSLKPDVAARNGKQHARDPSSGDAPLRPGSG